MKRSVERFASILLTACILLSVIGCSEDKKGGSRYGSLPDAPSIDQPSRYSEFEFSREKLQSALDAALEKTDLAMLTFTDTFPSHSSVDNVYGEDANTGGWNQGFWSGILWHAYQLTGSAKYKNAAQSQLDSYYERITRKLGVDHHDMGFLYVPSCVAAYKISGDTDAKFTAVLAADHLLTRYHEKGEFIQAWGSTNDKNSYRLIVDCLMNLSLLYWASEVTGDESYAEIAYKHFLTTAYTCYREDGSTYHTYYFDPETGLPLKGATAQGASDDSAWARGQAWSIYGAMITYKYTKSEEAMTVFKAAANYYLNHLPEDLVAYWDLSFTDGEEPRDSSAAAIAVCGMLEGIKYMDESDPLREIYKNACNRIMNSLIDGYTTKDLPQANGLLLHATYNRPSGDYDEMNIWGDYFYMEALHRMLNENWELYW